MNAPRTLLVIFGITGDLARRKLLPGLHNLIAENLVEDTKIIGISRREIDRAELLDAAHTRADDGAMERLQAMLTIHTMDVASHEDYELLKDEIARVRGPETDVIFYLAVPPAATLPIIERLGTAGLNDARIKVLLEKPFGEDFTSADESIRQMEQYFHEDQLYRIDHYLAKEMAQNIIAFRSHNAIFRNLWHKDFIEKIDIIASEQIGIEGRTNFYEQTGALRDFLQNHLMQLMALTLMDIPSTFDMKEIPERRAAALKAIEPLQSDTLSSAIVRGQYEGYAAEVGNPGTLTETFVSVLLHSSDPRWAGVPIRLATGKSLAERTTEIRVHFKKTHVAESNLLVLHIQPKEGITIDLWAKKPGYDKDYEKMSLNFDYPQPSGKPVEAYERVLLDAVSSDKSLFSSADEVLASWRILQPVQEYWAFHDDDLVRYHPGELIEQLMS